MNKFVSKLFRFLLLIAYVAAVLCVTTVTVKAYNDRTNTDGEEQQDSEEVMAVKADLDAGGAVAGYEEQDSNEEQDSLDEQGVNGEQAGLDGQDANGEQAGLDRQDANGEQAGLGEQDVNEEQTGLDEQDSSDESEQIERIYLEYFAQLRTACEQFIAELRETDEPESAYEKTLRINQEDKKRIMENQYDFSQMKIACLGDSLTAASNLENEENYEQYAYPTVLKEALGAEEVYNLGIGGSSIGRYWFEPFVERYTDIPEDADIIIVMGGYNDGFCVSEDEFGSLEERKPGTFCGDLDELMRGIKENYPNAVVFFATPMSTALHGALMSQRPSLLSQEYYVLVMEALAKEYDFEFVDLYNTGFLDSYDENVAIEFIPDNTHGNPAGYRILAERLASEIVEYYAKLQQNELMEIEESEEAVDDEQIEESEKTVDDEKVEESGENIDDEKIKTAEEM